jgi:hypothetical protein
MSGFIKVPTVAKTTHSVTCPCCGKYSWTVDHLFEAAPKHSGGHYTVHWDCNKCQEDFEIHVYGPDRVEFKQKGKKANPFIPALVLLKSCHEESPVYALVETSSHLKSIKESQLPEDHPDAGGGMRYYYDESTCPTNWFRDVTKLIHEGDDDPHGVFTFVAALSQEEAMAYLEKHHQTQRSINRPGGGKPDVEFIEFGENVRLLFPQAFGEGQTLDGVVMRDGAGELTRAMTFVATPEDPGHEMYLYGDPSAEERSIMDKWLVKNTTPTPSTPYSATLAWPPGITWNQPAQSDTLPTETQDKSDAE